LEGSREVISKSIIMEFKNFKSEIVKKGMTSQEPRRIS
jgi:cell fate (sporulation/competence/biofilm development) regulator YlbF (YheA/YmcA/DUF963 family)